MHKLELEKLLSSVPRAVSEKTLMSVSSLLFEAVDSPRSLAAYILLKEGEYAQLVNLEINPDNYLKAHAFADDYLATKFLSKYPDFRHKDLNPEKKALESFYEFEEVCKITNSKFKKLDEDPSLWDPTMLRIFRRARRKISSILREPDIESISDNFGWGPGATTSSSGNLTSAYIKFSKRLDVTGNCLVLGLCCINSIPSWVNCQLQTDEFPGVEACLTDNAFNIVRGNEIVFVPKNAKTHRIIAKEPHVNSYLQKGFGAEIRRLLRIGAGIDLKDQSVNQRLALRGSLNDDLSTIDLSGASDTISREIVKFLLPKRWYTLLDQIRSQQGFLRKERTWIQYAKFSSMGNGSTFELESLIFYALCKSCLEETDGDQTCNVYGDDIVIPSYAYDLVAQVIDFAGFRVNDSKSYSHGRFRESCGKDYFFGTDVRPIFLKESLSNVECLFKLANSVRRYSHRRNFNYGCDKRFYSLWLHAVSLIPPILSGFRIPEGFGDIGVLSNFDEACPSRPAGHKFAGWGGFLFKGIIRTPAKQVMKDRHAGYTATLYGNRNSTSTQDSSHILSILLSGGRFAGDPIRFVSSWIDDKGPGQERLPLLGHHDLRRMTYSKVARIHTHGWCDLGPWQ